MTSSCTGGIDGLVFDFSTCFLETAAALLFVVPKSDPSHGNIVKCERFMHHHTHGSCLLSFSALIDSCVLQFKEAISAKFSGAAVENLCLIFAGKIMKDQETLASHNVKANNMD